MCQSCDLGLPCESGGMGCNAGHAPPNPMIDLIRGASRPTTTPVGRMAAGCAVRPAGIAAPPFGYDPLMQRQAYAFDPKRYLAVNRAMGYSSDYRRKSAGATDGAAPGTGMTTTSPNGPPAPAPSPPAPPAPPASPASGRMPIVPLALAFVAGAIFYSVVK